MAPSVARTAPNHHTAPMSRPLSSRALALLRASHPEPGGAVTVALTLLAVGVGHRGWRLAGVVAAVAATQLAVGWVNDWLDADRDRVAGRADKPVAAGTVGRRTVGVAGLISALEKLREDDEQSAGAAPRGGRVIDAASGSNFQAPPW